MQANADFILSTYVIPLIVLPEALEELEGVG